MENSKTIETINKFCSIVKSNDNSKESSNFLCTFELELAKSLLIDFSDESCNKLVQILSVCVNID